MTFLYFLAGGEPPLLKIPHVDVPSEASSAVVGSLVEVMTVEEWDLLQKHIELNFYTLQNDGPESKPLSLLLHGHVILVTRRISNQANEDGPYFSLYLNYLLRCPPITIWLRHLSVCKKKKFPFFQALVDAGGHLDMAKYNGETVFSILNWRFSYLKGVYRGYSAPILQITNKHRFSTFSLLHSSPLKARNSIRCGLASTSPAGICLSSQCYRR